MENPHEERQALLLERIIKNVDLVNDALVEMNRSLQEVNAYNTKSTVVGELWEGYRRNVAFNLASMEEQERGGAATQ
ncbi:hypothetical protein CBS101457_004651 [Exobasidium rhododendri]|nr:hypothetical protein CBS101457_004651 [Exobasidium rhododendri]